MAKSGLPKNSFTAALGLKNTEHYAFYWYDYEKDASLEKCSLFDDIIEKIKQKVELKETIQFEVVNIPLRGKSAVVKVANSVNASHRVVLIQVKDSWISLEKSLYGLLVQYAKSRDSVLTLKANEKRKVGHESEREPKLDEQLLQLKRLEDVLNVFKEKCSGHFPIQHYTVTKHNCIKFAKKIAKACEESTFKISVRFPGRTELVKIDDHDTRIAYFRSQYPDWSEKVGVTYIPQRWSDRLIINQDEIGEISTPSPTKVLPKDFDPFNVLGFDSIDGIVENVQFEVKYLEMVESILNGNAEANPILNGNAETTPILNGNAETNPILNGNDEAKMATSKSILNGYNSALFLPDLRSENVIKAIRCSNIGDTSFCPSWSDLLRHVILSQQFGLVCILDPFGAHAESTFVQAYTILQQVYRVGDAKEKDCPIHLLSVEHDSTGGGVPCPVKEDDRLLGYLIKGNEKTLPSRLQKYFEDVIASRKGKIVSKDCVERLASLFMVLHLLEKGMYEMHVKYQNQEFAGCAGIVWTKEQSRILNYVREKFATESEHLRLLVKGCPGSGKTLVLLQIAVTYLAKYPERKVLLRILNNFAELTKGLRDKINVVRDFAPLKDRLVIEHDPRFDTINQEQFSLVLVDEFEGVYLHGPEFQFVASCGKKPVHLVIATSIKAIDCKSLNNILIKAKSPVEPSEESIPASQQFNEEEHTRIYGGDVCFSNNCRSSDEIVSFVNKLHKAVHERFCRNFRRSVSTDVNAFYSNLNLDGDVVPAEKAVFSFKQGPVSIVECDDPSRERFIQKSSDFIRDTIKEMKVPGLVSHLCHKSIVDGIESSLKDKCLYPLKFLTPKAALGAQFPVVFAVIDMESTSTNMTRLIDVATRATLRLVILWNNTREPYRAPGGHLYFGQSTCTTQQINRYFEQELPYIVKHGNNPYRNPENNNNSDEDYKSMYKFFVVDRSQILAKRKCSKGSKSSKGSMPSSPFSPSLPSRRSETSLTESKEPMPSSPLSPFLPSKKPAKKKRGKSSSTTMPEQKESMPSSPVSPSPPSRRSETLSASFSSMTMTEVKEPMPSSPLSPPLPSKKPAQKKRGKSSSTTMPEQKESMPSSPVSPSPPPRSEMSLSASSSSMTTELKESMPSSPPSPSSLFNYSVIKDVQEIFEKDHDAATGQQQQQAATIFVLLRPINFGNGIGFRESVSTPYPIHLAQIVKPKGDDGKEMEFLQTNEDRWNSERAEKIKILYSLFGECRDLPFVDSKKFDDLIFAQNVLKTL